MRKLKPGTLTSGRIKNNFKGTTKRFIAKGHAFSFMGLFKGAPAYRKQFSYDVLAMVKQFVIPTNFPALTYADLSWEKLPQLINKMISLGFSDEKLKNLKL